MKLRATSPLLDWTGEAAISTRHPASHYGMPILLIDDEPVHPTKTDWAGYEVLEATAHELELLRRGNYRFNLFAA
jgi:hypothetical protein